MEHQSLARLKILTPPIPDVGKAEREGSLEARRVEQFEEIPRN